MNALPAALLMLLLAACGAQPAPHMSGAERFEARRDGRDYVLFLKDNRVEIIRLGHAKPGEHQQIRATMIALIPELTGCRLREAWLQGDSGEMRGRVFCPRAPPPSRMAPRTIPKTAAAGRGARRRRSPDASSDSDAAGSDMAEPG
ncbi:hypothetical protein [Pseudogemmobacter sonorensis]|uniref:hypothetical protein n=1 Tax=Pseudogemmobacter sonorensis TaxID=2989681 RepID=UPI00367D6CE0